MTHADTEKCQFARQLDSLQSVLRRLDQSDVSAAELEALKLLALTSLRYNDGLSGSPVGRDADPRLKEPTFGQSKFVVFGTSASVLHRTCRSNRNGNHSSIHTHIHTQSKSKSKSHLHSL
ncbi:unnamed protein product [Protopolystoma xenopodis]|uniref:Uncharacterized protein n=1 Tax=Protopolystoma xenopodis TaxID=117903 RepID=A0A448WCP4_9PLAT|nr:unnamed protein product [Protopolystoma xenopodis]